MIMLTGTYNRLGYSIHNGDEVLYSAGNNHLESAPEASVHDARGRVSIRTLRKYCEQTGKEMAEEMGCEWGGCELEEE